MERRFEGMVVLVTGGSAGIGYATARAFAAEGAKVVIAARNAEAGDAAAAAIGAEGGVARFVPADVSDAPSVAALIDQTISIFGAPDIAFLNAGIGGEVGKSIQQASTEMFDEVIAVNVRGAWLSTKEVFRAMAHRGGSIAICGSAAGIRGGSGGASAYYTSKHAVMGLMKQAAMEGAKLGIRVNAVLPGMVATDMMAAAIGDDHHKREAFAARIPLRRMAEPDEIAKAVLFLCSRDASYITGAGLSIDGGLSV